MKTSEKKLNDSFGIHWFRRDLRVTGNLALKSNLSANEGKTIGVFFLDPAILSRKDTGKARLCYFLKTLEELKKELTTLNIPFLLIKSTPQDGFKHLISKLNGSTITQVSFNRDYEPYARDRDKVIETLLEKNSISVNTFRDHLILEPYEIQKPDGGIYQIFTPFSKRWFEHFRSSEILSRVDDPSLVNFKLKDKPPTSFYKIVCTIFSKESECEIESLEKSPIPLPKAGYRNAMLTLENFEKKLDAYHTDRDLPAELGTSQLSPFLKTGAITSAQVIRFLGLDKLLKISDDGPSVYLKELIWREFYFHILFHRPDVEKSSFNPKYRNLDWENDKSKFEAWKKGETGFPIVDAGMRQLNQTGWMHNRVRMIVASFLTKDLLIDWRWGEQYFMEKLIDGDLAANNGGWQWAASTGCDPQPYFRIFNPWLQAEKFDPDAVYIKRFVPELKALSAKEIHSPKLESNQYTKRIVDHKRQSLKAVSMYKNSP